MGQDEDALPPNDPPKRASRERPETRAGFASPPCFLHEVDPAYLGYLGHSEVLAVLNELLESARASAACAEHMGKRARSRETRSTLDAIAKDQARCCSMLAGHIERLGGTPSQGTGTLSEDLRANDTLTAQLKAFENGQGALVRKLREALPGIIDDSLRADLGEILECHDRNIARCRGVNP